MRAGDLNDSHRRSWQRLQLSQEPITRASTRRCLFTERARAPASTSGTRASLADIGQTVAENFGLKLTAGESFLAKVLP